MRLVRYAVDGEAGLGVLDGDVVIDISPDAPGRDDMTGLIARSARSGLPAPSDEAPRRAISEVEILAPLRPRKNIFAIGRNYIEHVREIQTADRTPNPPPEFPMVFTKPPTAIIGPGQGIDSRNDPSSTTDYEGELAVVLGIPGRGITREDAMRHVFGYTIVNDVTARALQRKHVQWFVGKGPDTFCPMGPCILTADEVPDVAELTIETSVNGELRQRGSLADLIFDIPTLVATLSSAMKLEAGDVIATGTPAGVGAGFDPPRYLGPGDVVEVRVDPIGALSNPVV